MNSSLQQVNAGVAPPANILEHVELSTSGVFSRKRASIDSELPYSDRGHFQTSSHGSPQTQRMSPRSDALPALAPLAPLPPLKTQRGLPNECLGDVQIALTPEGSGSQQQVRGAASSPVGGPACFPQGIGDVGADGESGRPPTRGGILSVKRNSIGAATGSMTTPSLTSPLLISIPPGEQQRDTGLLAEGTCTILSARNWALQRRRGSVDFNPEDHDSSVEVVGDGCSEVRAAAQVSLPPLLSSSMGTSLTSRGRHVVTDPPECSTAAGDAEVLARLSSPSSQASVGNDEGSRQSAPTLALVIETFTNAAQPLVPSGEVSHTLDTRKGSTATIQSKTTSTDRSPLFLHRPFSRDAASDANTKTEDPPSTSGGGSYRGTMSLLSSALTQLVLRGSSPGLSDGVIIPETTPAAASAGVSGAVEANTASPIPGAGVGRIRTESSLPENCKWPSDRASTLTCEQATGRRSASLHSLGDDNGVTARRWAPEGRQFSDSTDEIARDVRCAARRSKKAEKAARMQSCKNGHVAEGGAGVPKEDRDPAAAVCSAAAVPKSGSALQRKRERKRQLRYQKMKGMTSLERREYKAEHHCRRAKKKALRMLSVAAPKPREEGDNNTHLQRDQHLSPCKPSTRSVPMAPTNKTPFFLSSQPLSLQRNPAVGPAAIAESQATSPSDPAVTSAGRCVPEDAMATLPLGDQLGVEQPLATFPPQFLDATCRPLAEGAMNGGGDGGNLDQQVLTPERSCMNEKEGTRPIPSSAASPSRVTLEAPTTFRRRFVSNPGVSKLPILQELGCTSTAPEIEKQPVPHSENFGKKGDVLSGEKAWSCADSDGGTDGVAVTGAPTAGAAIAASTEMDNQGTLSDGSPPSSATPHPPPAAAGSGAAAIAGLKQRREGHQRSVSHTQPPAEVLPAVTGSATKLSDADISSAAVSRVSSLSRSGSERDGSLRLSDDLQQLAMGASYSGDPGPSPCFTGDAASQLDVDACPTTGHAAVSVPSSNSSRRSFHDRHEPRSGDGASANRALPHTGGASQKNEMVDDDGARYAAAAAAAVLPKPRRHSSSSCSSLRSRSSDESINGSSAYSYSSYSSSGSLVPEVLPLPEGCTTPPPATAFTDLKYRYGCVGQLRSCAEPAVIHEWNLIEGCWGSVETSVVVSTQPFSQGNMRASYYMIDMRRPNCLLVAKRYLKSSVSDDQYFDDVSMHSISGHWARLFNTMNPPKKVRFVPAAVLILTKRTPPLILAMEPLLKGTFVKYNNNCGYVRSKARWTPQAFSHFTYHASEHELMVVDIQGVDDYYTDPQILSPDGEGYGRGNLGKEGIKRFLESHRCNDVCRAVGLPPLQRGAKGVVDDVLVPPGSGRGGSRPATPAAPSSVLREERLPPKMFTLARRLSSGNATSHEFNSNDARSRSTSHGSRLRSEAPVAAAAGPPAASPRASQRLARPLSSGSSSPIPTTLMPSPLALGALPSRVVPPMQGGVKYVRYPRNAQVRPQSQYFASTVAGGFMAVPQQPALSPHGTNASGGFSNNSMSSIMHSFASTGDYVGGKSGSGSLANGCQATSNGLHSTGRHKGVPPSPQNIAVPAVPLLRPPAGARAAYTGSPTIICQDVVATPVKGQEGMSTPHPSTPVPPLHLGGPPGMGCGMPTFFPHPPMAGTTSVPSEPRLSQNSPSISAVPLMQAPEDARTTQPSAGSRRHSFNRRPLFSSVEEVPMVLQNLRARHHRHHHLHSTPPKND